MKTKLILQVLLSVVLIQISQAQNRPKFIDYNNRWITRTFTYNRCPFPQTNTCTYNMEFSFDSIAPSFFTAGSAMVRDSIFSSGHWYYRLNPYYVYFRESNRRIYSKYIDSDEILQYDFNLNIGDSMRISNEQPASFNVRDTAIFTYNNINYKLMLVQVLQGANNIWIEGIGSMYSPVFNLGDLSINALPSENWVELHCFLNNEEPLSLGNLYYQRLGTACTLLNLEEFSSAIPFNFINIYPNPASQHIQLQSPHAIQQIEIYNTQGKIVMQEKAEGNSNVRYQLSISQLPAGVYICRALTAKGWISNKFIKQ